MYLINTETLQLERFEEIRPDRPFAILSHTWGDDEATFATFRDSALTKQQKQEKFHKIELICRQAKEEGLKYAWVDTCCINKDSSAELSEAINSMYRWYQRAAICYAYLQDYDASDPLAQFGKCKWFSRGWTLQELIAPREVVFYGAGWCRIGLKTDMFEQLEDATGIPADVLCGKRAIQSVSVAARMSWASQRITSRSEDMAYCLMGIFDVNMPLLYGEGSVKAYVRLQQEIMGQTQDDSLFVWCADSASAAQFPFRGLFASSPQEFKDCAEVVSFNIDNAGATTLFGNGRVSLNCDVIKTNRGTLLGLKCYSRDIRSALGIQAIRVGTNTYLRSNPSKLTTFAMSSFEENIIIERYSRKSALIATDTIHRRDGIWLGDLPRRLKLKAIHPKNLLGGGKRSVSVVDAVRQTIAFEIEYDGKSTILLLFWVEPELTAGSYLYYFDTITYKTVKSVPQILKTAKRPFEVHTNRTAQFGTDCYHFRTIRRDVHGYSMYCVDVILEQS